MAKKPPPGVITVQLTDADKAMLRNLIRAEARRLGYGTAYVEGRYQHMHPHTGWPRRLKKLAALITKLR